MQTQFYNTIEHTIYQNELTFWPSTNREFSFTNSYQHFFALIQQIHDSGEIGQASRQSASSLFERRQGREFLLKQFTP